MTHLVNDVTLADSGAEPEEICLTRPPRRFLRCKQTNKSVPWRKPISFLFTNDVFAEKN